MGSRLSFNSSLEERRLSMSNKEEINIFVCLRRILVRVPWFICDDFPKERPQYDNKHIALAEYQNATSNIEYAKQNSWRAAYYLVLFYAGIVGLSTVPRFGDATWERVLLIVAVIFSWAFYWGVLRDTHKKMADQRMKLKQSCIYFSDAMEDSFRPHFASYYETIGYITNLLIIGTIAAIAVTALLLQ